jgi:hypothetical protein
MLALARDKTDAAHPYFVPPAHTRRARKIIGPGKLLAPAQAVILETHAERARAAAREYVKVGVLGNEVGVWIMGRLHFDLGSVRKFPKDFRQPVRLEQIRQ